MLHPIKYVLFLCSFLFGSAVSVLQGSACMRSAGSLMWNQPPLSAKWHLA